MYIDDSFRDIKRGDFYVDFDVDVDVDNYGYTSDTRLGGK